MIELLLKVIDKLLQLSNERRDNNKELYDIYVVPTFLALEELHQNYLETFRSYRRDLASWEYPLTPDHPLLNRIREDSLYSAQLRSRLSVLRNLYEDPLFGSLIIRIVQYTQGTVDSKHIVLDGRERLRNAPRSMTIRGLISILSSDEPEANKLERGLNLLDRVVSELQISYQKLLEINLELKRKLLDNRL